MYLLRLLCSGRLACADGPYGFISHHCTGYLFGSQTVQYFFYLRANHVKMPSSLSFLQFLAYAVYGSESVGQCHGHLAVQYSRGLVIVFSSF